MHPRPRCDRVHFEFSCRLLGGGRPGQRFRTSTPNTTLSPNLLRIWARRRSNDTRFGLLAISLRANPFLREATPPVFPVVPPRGPRTTAKNLERRRVGHLRSLWQCRRPSRGD